MVPREATWRRSSPSPFVPGWIRLATFTSMTRTIAAVVIEKSTTMDVRLRWVATLTALAASAGAMTAEGRSDGEFQIKLKASLRNQGEIAWASFAPNGDSTAMVLNVSGVPSYFVRPVRLYTYIYRGSCVQLPASPAYELNEVVVPFRRPGPPFTLNKSVPLPSNQLRSGGYSVVVRSSPPDGNIDLFCGDIR
jgi:hypothetical protein